MVLANPHAARALGIETIYQDLALADNLDVGANVFLGREPTTRRLGFLPALDRRRMQAAASEVLRTLEIEIPASKLTLPVRTLSGGQRQAVAIGRAIYWQAAVLIMDEPTAALGVPEQRKVRELILRLKQQRVGVIFISHNLVDIFAVADRILVLRRGRAAGERRTARDRPRRDRQADDRRRERRGVTAADPNRTAGGRDSRTRASAPAAPVKRSLDPRPPAVQTLGIGLGKGGSSLSRGLHDHLTRRKRQGRSTTGGLRCEPGQLRRFSVRMDSQGRMDQRTDDGSEG